MKKLLTKIKAKAKPLKKSFWRFLYLSILGLITISMIVIIIFISKNLITALKFSEEIIILKREIAPKAFNIDDFNQAIENLDKKTDPAKEINWSTVNNIFLETGRPEKIPASSPAGILDQVSPR